MPTYDFKCPKCGVFEEFAPMGADSTSCSCGKQAKRLFSPTTAFHIPAYMAALGMASSERQAVYLKSEKHRKNRAQQEKQAESDYQRAQRLETNEKKLAQTITARVEDNARYADQSPPAVSKRAKEYRATGFAK
jgi:putative FmdB family regulatory protein